MEKSQAAYEAAPKGPFLLIISPRVLLLRNPAKNPKHFQRQGASAEVPGRWGVHLRGNLCPSQPVWQELGSPAWASPIKYPTSELLGGVGNPHALPKFYFYIP